MVNRIVACLSLLLVLVVLGAAGQGPGLREVERRPFQLALVTPAQIFPEEHRIGGIRINLLYGRNVAVAGVDVGIVNHTTRGPVKGLQFGVVGITEANFYGVQNNLLNITERRFEGVQWGLVNVTQSGGGFQYGAANGARDISGFQLGVVNVADRMGGLQIGLVNYAKRASGLQIGLINIIEHDGFLPVFPIVNWSF